MIKIDLSQGLGILINDPNAVHVDKAQEINQLDEKFPVTPTDVFIIEDSEDSWAKKKVEVSGITIDTIGDGATFVKMLHSERLDIATIKLEIPAIQGTIAAIETALDVEEENSIHKSTSAEINSIPLKSSPISSDIVIIEDSENSWSKKKAPYPIGGGGTDPNAVHLNVSNEFSTLDIKENPVFEDAIIIEDSQAGMVKKQVPYPAQAVRLNEWGQFTESIQKLTLSQEDRFLIEDSQDTLKKKMIKFSEISIDTIGDGATFVKMLHSERLDIATIKLEIPAIQGNVAAIETALDVEEENSIHKSTPNEINGINEKLVTVLADKVLIEDSEDTWNKKSVQISNLIPPIYKSIFIPAQTDSALGNRRVQAVAGTGAYNFNFMFPLDFVEFGPSGGIFVVGFPQTGVPGTDRDIDLNIEYDNGPNTSRTYYTTGDASTLYDLTGTLNVQWLLPFHTLISDPGAGKTGGINVDHNAIGGTISYIGVLL